MQKTPQNNSDAQTTSQPAAPQFDEMPQRKKSLSVWSLATAFCSATQRLFANFVPCWPIRQFSLQWFTKLLLRFSHTSMQWIVRRIPFLPWPSKLKFEEAPPRRPSRTKQISIRTSRRMTRGAALSRVSISKRGVSLSSWAAVRIKRRDWLASKELWHRRACRYVGASCRKGVTQLKAIAQAIRQSVVDLHQCLHKNAQTEKRRDRRAREKKKSIAHQASPVTQQLISRAITVAAYTLSLECGRMLALPTWLRIICAYSVAALVPTLLPNAHGDNCRVFTTISASALAATLASPAAAVGVTFVLCLCPYANALVA